MHNAHLMEARVAVPRRHGRPLKFGRGAFVLELAQVAPVLAAPCVLLRPRAVLARSTPRSLVRALSFPQSSLRLNLVLGGQSATSTQSRVH